MMKGKRIWDSNISFYLVATLIIGVAFACCLNFFSIYPDTGGTDTYGHLFKINYLYHSLLDGTIYPIYTEYWYNSMELFRYWPPLAYYVVALLQFFTAGNVVEAFYVFAGVAYAINMGGWFLIGKSEKRLGIAFLVGTLYFFCPDNLRIFMAEGNIPRVFIGVLLPYVFYFVWRILEYKQYRKLIGLAVVIWIITVSHYMIAAMTGIAVFLFAAIYSIMNKEWRQIVYITVDLVLAYLMSGIFLIPGLTGGGITSQTSEASVEAVEMWAQEAVRSLNPFFRFENGLGTFYFGLVIFVIAVLGIIASNRKMGPGFIAAVAIFFCTTEVVAQAIKLLPLSQVFWMQRFVPMAMCMFFLSLLLWKRLRKGAIIVMCVLMLADSAMAAYILMDAREKEPEEIAVALMEEYMISDAAKVTQNRIGILDKSMIGAIPSWYLSKDMDENSTLYSFGWAVQGAETMSNIVTINEATESGYYVYAFDRFLELGDDTILIDKNMIPKTKRGKLNEAANQVGYELYAENEKVWIYRHRDVNGPFGIIKKYRNLAIGEQAKVISYLYPQFTYGHSGLLEDYTVEELSSYEKIYLSGFDYNNEEDARLLLEEVASRGTKIYIDMQHIPLDKISGKAEFMDVYAQHIAFTEKFPVMSNNNGSQFKLDSRTVGYEVWNTVYLSGADNSIKEAYYDNATNLTYVATHGHDNIIFLGLNPVYYYFEDSIPELLTFLNETFEEVPEQNCESIIVPIEVEYNAREVVVHSEKDNVITGVANLDCFTLKNGEEKNSIHNLLTVDSGVTTFKVQYTNLLEGSIVSLIGLIGGLMFWVSMYRKTRREEKV